MLHGTSVQQDLLQRNVLSGVACCLWPWLTGNPGLQAALPTSPACGGGHSGVATSLAHGKANPRLNSKTEEEEEEEEGFSAAGKSLGLLLAVRILGVWGGGHSSDIARLSGVGSI